MSHEIQEVHMQIMIFILVIELIIWGGLLVSSMSGRKPEKNKRRLNNDPIR
jgi:hypothetical protein